MARHHRPVACSSDHDDPPRQIPEGWPDEYPQRRGRIRDPQTAALLRARGVPERLIGPTPPEGWSVVWSGTGRPVVLDADGREAGWFLDVLFARSRQWALAERDGIPFSWWPRCSEPLG